jgi:hypothetical protein
MYATVFVSAVLYGTMEIRHDEGTRRATEKEE